MVLDAARAENPSGATPAASAAPAASWMKLRLFMVSSLKHCLVTAALFALPGLFLFSGPGLSASAPAILHCEDRASGGVDAVDVDIERGDGGVWIMRAKCREDRG